MQSSGQTFPSYDGQRKVAVPSPPPFFWQILHLKALRWPLLFWKAFSTCFTHRAPSMLKARLASVLGHRVTVTGLPLLSAEPWPHLAQNWTHRGLNKQTSAKGRHRLPQSSAVTMECPEPAGQAVARRGPSRDGQRGNSRAL